MAAKIKKGDKVVVLAGRDKGRSGEVIEVRPTDERVLVRGVNIVARHQRQTAAQQAAYRGRRLGGERRPVGIALQDRRERFRHIVAIECAPPGEHLVQHATEGPHVSAPVYGLALRLLRGHVSSRPEDDTGMCGHVRNGRRV